jgi:hypothetical protein
MRETRRKIMLTRLGEGMERKVFVDDYRWKQTLVAGKTHRL